MEQTKLLYCRYWVRANQLYQKHNFPHVLIGLEIIKSPADNNNRKKGCVYAAVSRKSCLSVKFVSFRQSCASAHFGPCLWGKLDTFVFLLTWRQTSILVQWSINYRIAKYYEFQFPRQIIWRCRRLTRGRYLSYALPLTYREILFNVIH